MPFVADDKLAEREGGPRSCIEQLDVKLMRYFYGLVDRPFDRLAVNGCTGRMKADCGGGSNWPTSLLGVLASRAPIGSTPLKQVGLMNSPAANGTRTRHLPSVPAAYA